jgi:HlyD family secretion protein
MKSKKAWLAGGLILVGIIAATVGQMHGGQPVEVVQATRGTFTLMVEETGYVQSVNDREVQATQAGRVVDLLVETGDRVKAGQLLMRLSSPELSAEAAAVRSQLARAESELRAAQLGEGSLHSEQKQAEKDLARKKTLLESGALARVDYDQAVFEMEQLKQQLAQQQATIAGAQEQVNSLGEMLGSLEEKAGELQVISPTTGTVLDLTVKAGQVAAPGDRLAQIGSESQLEVRTELLSDEVRRVKIGQTTRVTAPVLGNQVLIGRVGKIYPQAYEKISALGVAQRRVPVIIALEQNGNLRPGYEVRAGIETVRKEKALLLPRESVQLTADGQYRVLAVVQGRIRERIIRVGEKNQQWVEVLEGLKGGETVVRDGSRELKEGTRVKAKQ